jgi:ribosomal subunit interface protein
MMKIRRSMMQVAVTFRHMEADEGVKAYVKGKVQKLQKYIENPREVHVVLSVEKFRHIAEITIVGNGGTFNSQGRDNDLYAAIDQMVEKMERQIRERRVKVRRKVTLDAKNYAAMKEIAKITGSLGFQAKYNEGTNELDLGFESGGYPIKFVLSDKPSVYSVPNEKDLDLYQRFFTNHTEKMCIIK